MTATQQNSPLPLAGKRVLIVEDEGLTQMQIRRMLLHLGAQIVGQALNGQEAIDIALREQPDIVLMDINMPIMNGLDAAEQILTQSSPCLVFLTAYMDEAYRQKAQAMGARGYVNKPIIQEILIPVILQACF